MKPKASNNRHEPRRHAAAALTAENSLLQVEVATTLGSPGTMQVQSSPRRAWNKIV
jgi:hypothetical protein